MSGSTRRAKTQRPPSIGVLRRAGIAEPRSLAAAAAALPRLAGRGGSLGFVSHVNAHALGAKPAVIDRRGTLTWSELDGRANRLARALERRGVGPGATVSTLLRNGREMVEVVYASQKLGAVAAPLNTWARPHELRAALESALPRVLVYDARHRGQIDEAGPREMERLVVADDPEAPGADAYERVVDAEPARPLPALTLHRGRPRVVIHTSGTTGKPKGASRGAGRSDAGAFLDLLSVVPLHRRDVILCPAPLFHSFGMLNLTIWTLLGATLILPDAFDPVATLALAERHGATACAFVPVMLHRIVSLPPDRRRADLSNLRAVMASGSSIPPALRERIREVFGEVLYDLYGSTETGLVAVATPRDVAAHPESVGRVLPGVELAVIGDDGSRVPPGEAGRLCVRSEGAFEGYTGGERTEEIGGFLAIGDTGRLDQDGYLYVHGRADEMVIVGGENVYPVEVEEVVLRIDGVRDVAVAGLDDSEYGQVLAAFVVGDVTEAQVVQACRGSLASYKVPRRVELLQELPRTATGKVLVRELVARFGRP